MRRLHTLIVWDFIFQLHTFLHKKKRFRIICVISSGLISGKKKAHKHNCFGPVGFGTRERSVAEKVYVLKVHVP